MHDDVYNNSLTHESPKYSVFERQMLSMIKTLNCKVDTVLMNQSKLNLHLMPGERVIAIPHGMPSIPLKSEDELRSMEKYLDVGDNVTSLSMLLSCYVSKDERLEYKSTLKLLPNLICNNVAKSFSLAGQRGKGAFNKLKVYTAMRAAMLCKLPQSDLLEMERACKVWLRDAAYRVQGDGGTSKRCKTPKHSKASKEKSKGRSKEKSKK